MQPDDLGIPGYEDAVFRYARNLRRQIVYLCMSKGLRDADAELVGRLADELRSSVSQRAYNQYGAVFDGNSPLAAERVSALVAVIGNDMLSENADQILEAVKDYRAHLRDRGR